MLQIGRDSWVGKTKVALTWERFDSLQILLTIVLKLKPNLQ